MMDKVQKHNSFNANTPPSESYRIYKMRSISSYRRNVISSVGEQKQKSGFEWVVPSEV
jgi:hypothetical protein